MNALHLRDSFEAPAGNTADLNGDNVFADGRPHSLRGRRTTPNVLYGGTDDDEDDSGEISYLSIRYGGRVVGLGNELNGLSLGGIGRGTDIEFTSRS